MRNLKTKWRATPRGEPKREVAVVAELVKSFDPSPRSPKVLAISATRNSSAVSRTNLTHNRWFRLAGFVLVFAVFSFASHVDAQSDSDDAVVADDKALEVVEVPLVLEEQTWFTDVVGTAVIQFPETVEQSEHQPTSTEDVSFLNSEVMASGKIDAVKSQAVIRFLPRHAGVAVFPPLEFQSETRIYRTPATQFLVSIPQKSKEMRFEFNPTKTTVYVGQPVRMDVTWSSQQPANLFRSLQCVPQVFQRDDVEIVIPRCTASEEQQMGLPFGGRRIIARRTPPVEDDTLFGLVSFSVFLRFQKPGKIEIPSARLECALLKGKAGPFAPYAAYYNNGLFEPLSSLDAYERVFTESTATSIQVLPLPGDGRSELFSNLFTPCEIDVAISTQEITVGQVLSVDLRIHSDAPHGMLDLQPLDLQRSLRGRFQVSKEFGRTWFPDGTGFRARVRPLTTDIAAFPSLRIPVFDASGRTYRFLQTASIPLRVHPHEGRDYFDVRTLSSEHTFSDQPTGIWHNARPGKMNQLMNSTTAILAEHVYLWIAAAAAIFLLLLPWVRERRRQAINPVYRRQAMAYRELLRQPEGTRQKWEAFLRFVATGFSMPAGAWTTGDAKQRLHSLDLPNQDIELIAETNEIFDRGDFSSQHTAPVVPELNAVAGRLMKQFRSASLLLLVVLVACPETSMASEWATERSSEWAEAESLFERALESTPGLPETEAMYAQSALKFENAAEAESRQGAAWYNAGNAWFKAGELGRAIACYRQARIFRPFDRDVSENLKAARALTVDVLDDQGALPVRFWPVRWISAALVPVWIGLLITILLHVRFKKSATLAGCVIAAVAFVSLGLVGIYAQSHSGNEGVVIVGEIYARKGPAYTYDAAFNEPLHDGLEFHVKAQRAEWLQIELADGHPCWIPKGQARLIFNRRI